MIDKLSKFLGYPKNSIYNRYVSSKINLTINVSVVSFIVCFPYIFIFGFFRLKIAQLGVIPTLCVYIFAIFLAQKKLYDFSRFVIVAGTSLSLFFYANLLGPIAGAQFLLFSLAAVPMSIYEFNKKKWIIFTTSLPFISYFILELLRYNAFQSSELLPLEIGKSISYFAALTTFILIFFFVFFHTRSNWIYSSELDDQNQFLNQKNKELIDAYKQLEDKKKLDIEFEIAQEQQEEFLPAEMPRIPGYTIQHYFKGARGVSGDFFDYRCFGRVVKFFVADVMSKSMSAAFVTVHLYSMFRTLITAKMSPSRLLNTMNRAFVEGRGSHEKAAAFAFELDTNTHTITYAHACIGIAISILNGEVKELEVSGMMAGADASVDYKMFRFQLAPGDMMIVASDGLEDFKMRDGKRFGHKRIMEEIQFYAANKVGIGVGFRDFMVKRFEDLCDLDALQADDVVLIVVQRD